MQSKTIHAITVEPGSRIADRYEVRDRLGSGGMGVVYRCIDRELGDVVALKLLHAHLAQDEEVFARFRNEVLVARALSHPNIVRIHDMGRAEEGFSYISMELVDGFSLHDRIVRRKAHPEMPTTPLSFQEALEILYQVCCGVAYAHDKGIIHRDLKPANVMLSARGEVKLGDFGTARIVGMDRSLTQAGQVIGTPDYMAPEQIRGEQLDASCDIYALGVIAYELAVGQKPFIAESAVAVAFKHLNEPIPSFANPAAGIPKWYEDIVRKATAKNRAERYPSAFEFAQALCDNAPQLRNKSVLFMSEQRAASRNSREAAQSVGVTKPSDSSYHLGDQSQAGGDSWVFGSYSPDQGLSNPPTPTTISVKRRSPFLAGFLFLLVALAALAFAVRSVSSLNSWVGNRLPQWEQETGSDLSGVRALLGIGPLTMSSAPSSIGLGGDSSSSIAMNSALSTPPSSASSAAPDLDMLERQLLSEAGIPSSVPSSSAAFDSSTQSSAAPSVVQASSSVTVVTSSVPSSSATEAALSSASVMSSSSERSTSTAEELFSAAAISGALIIAEERGGAASGAIDLEKLSHAQWRAVLNGAPTGIAEGVLRKLVRQQFRANVVSKETGKNLATMEFQVTKTPTPEQPTLAVAGDFAPLRDNNSLTPGAYRLELYRGESLVKAREFSLYRLAVGSTSSSASQNIVIATGPTYVPGQSSSSVVSSIAAEYLGAEGPVTAQNPGVTIVTPPPASSLPFTQSSSFAWSNTGMLPPARRGSEDFPSSVTMAQSSEPASFSSAAPAPAQDVYLGRFFTEGGEGTDGRRLELRLLFTGVDISGTASIEGMGEFSVDGKVYQRGLELNLRGATQIRLSAGRQETTIRGRYNIPAEQKSGSWVASKR